MLQLLVVVYVVVVTYVLVYVVVLVIIIRSPRSLILNSSLGYPSFRFSKALTSVLGLPPTLSLSLSFASSRPLVSLRRGSLPLGNAHRRARIFVFISLLFRSGFNGKLRVVQRRRLALLLRLSHTHKVAHTGQYNRLYELACIKVAIIASVRARTRARPKSCACGAH